MAKKKSELIAGGADLGAPPVGVAENLTGGISVGVPLGSARPPTESEEGRERQEALARSMAEAEADAAILRAEKGESVVPQRSGRFPAPANGSAKPRSTFAVIGKDADGNYLDMLSTHKSLRRARGWITDNANMIRRFCAEVKVFRMREVTP